MMYRYLLLLAMFPAFANAQQPLDSKVYAMARSKVDSFVRSDLGIGRGGVDLRVYNQFKNLFDVNALAEDDFNAVYLYNTAKDTGTYYVAKKAKPFDIYAHNVALQVGSISIDSVGIIQSLDTVHDGYLKYSVFRKVTVTKERKYVLPVGLADSLMKSRNEIKFDEPGDSLLAIQYLKASIGKPATYQFTANSILTITLVVNTDQSVRIRQIETENKSIYCTNDGDNDAVINDNREDILPESHGDFTSGGRPDYDFDGIPDEPEKDKKDKKIENVIKNPDRCKDCYGKEANLGCPMDYFLTKSSLDGYAGLQMNSAKINLPELNQLGYADNAGNNAMDINQSKKGSLKNPGLRPGIHAAGNFSYYFGKNAKKSGLSIGAAFSAFIADYQLSDSVMMYTFKANDGEHDYRRRVTIDSLNESIRYSIFNFPVMFSFRTYFGRVDPDSPVQRKSVINIKAGPSLMIFNTTSEYDAYISMEGLYQTGNNGIIYEDNFDPNSDRNVFFTADKIFAQNPTRTAEDVFRELREANANYDFTDSKNYRGKQKNDSRLTVGINLDINLQHQITTEWAFRLGLQAVYAPLPERKDKYIPINKTTDPYNSIYNSGGKSAYAAFGLNVGLAYNFFSRTK